ncbi:hypothetical protein AVEN_236516-1, partial [Araneus ventricosus]
MSGRGKGTEFSFHSTLSEKGSKVPPSISVERNDSWHSRSNSASLSSPGSASSHSSITTMGLSKENEAVLPIETREAFAKFAPKFRCLDITHTEKEISRKSEIIESFEETIQAMHNDGLGNAPQCIQDMLKKRQLEGEHETLEDKLFAFGICPLSDSQTYHASLPENMDTDKQVRSKRKSPGKGKSSKVSKKLFRPCIMTVWVMPHNAYRICSKRDNWK